MGDRGGRGACGRSWGIKYISVRAREGVILSRSADWFRKVGGSLRNGRVETGKSGGKCGLKRVECDGKVYVNWKLAVITEVHDMEVLGTSYAASLQPCNSVK